MLSGIFLFFLFFFVVLAVYYLFIVYMCIGLFMFCLCEKKKLSGSDKKMQPSDVVFPSDLKLIYEILEGWVF